MPGTTGKSLHIPSSLSCSPQEHPELTLTQPYTNRTNSKCQDYELEAAGSLCELILSTPIFGGGATFHYQSITRTISP